MQAEDVDRASQMAQTPARQDGRAVLLQRAVEHVELGPQLGGIGIRRSIAHSVTEHLWVLEPACRRRQTRIDAGDGTAVGFVLPLCRPVGRSVGQGL